jgi:hypothetical protein
MDDELRERTEKEIEMMRKVFKAIRVKEDNNPISISFFDMASNYFSDCVFFFEKQDYIRAFESVVISWSYIDAGIKADFFTVTKDLKQYFTS